MIDQEALREKLDYKMKEYELNTCKSKWNNNNHFCIEKQDELGKLKSIFDELQVNIQIEHQKKLMIKEKLDQAFLRGASALSIEALMMSQASLNGNKLRQRFI